jgi:hypothetical protein
METGGTCVQWQAALCQWLGKSGILSSWTQLCKLAMKARVPRRVGDSFLPPVPERHQISFMTRSAIRLFSQEGQVLEPVSSEPIASGFYAAVDLVRETIWDRPMRWYRGC